MSKRASTFCLCMAVVGILSACVEGEQAKTFGFNSRDALTDWTITGDITTDQTRGYNGEAGSLKIGPGGKALLRLRDKDESGKVEVWVYDDGTVPEDPKANRCGPRRGLVQNDGKLLAIGALYASYLGGAEGYTATACDGRDWFKGRRDSRVRVSARVRPTPRDTPYPIFNLPHMPLAK